MRVFLQKKSMISNKKDKIKLLIPPILIELFYILKRTFINKSIYKLLSKNSILKKSKADKSAVFIGNGPSIKNVKFEEINGYDLIVCNDFYLHKLFGHIDIKYYVCIDPTPKWIENVSEYVNKGFFDDITLIVPVWSKVNIDKYQVFKKIKIHYVYPYGETKIMNRFFINISRPMIHIRNVTQFIIIFTNYLSYKNVFFLGVDMNHLCFKNKFNHPHFYKDSENVSVKVEQEYGEYSRNALSLSILFNSIKELNNITETKFFNANMDSYLEFIDFKEIP